MRLLFLFVVFLQTVLAFSQIDVEVDFEDGSFGGWKNSDNTEINLSVEPNDRGYLSLIKNGDGTNSGAGELTLINTTNFTGDLFCEFDGCAGGITFWVKNTNPFDMNFRLGIVGANNTKLLSEISSPLNFPLGTDWYFVSFGLLPEEFSTFEGDGTFEETMSAVVEIRIIQNEAYSFDGVTTIGTLEFEAILISFAVLSIDDQTLSSLDVTPNPTENALNIRARIPLETYTIYNMLGAKVAQGNISDAKKTIDVSALIAGTYLVEVTSEGQTTSKKFIKQ